VTVMLMVFFFDWKGIFHHEFVPRGETVNKEFYVKVMKRLREAVQRKRTEAWTNKTWMLHHDNAPPRVSLLIREFLAKQETIVMPQPPYSPDLAPVDFFLFPKLKSTLKGRRFQMVEEIKENLLQDLRAILQNTFQDAFRNWKNCWERCINSRGEYFEEDKSD
jgi:transposase